MLTNVSRVFGGGWLCVGVRTASRFADNGIGDGEPCHSPSPEQMEPQTLATKGLQGWPELGSGKFGGPGRHLGVRARAAPTVPERQQLATAYIPNSWLPLSRGIPAQPTCRNCRTWPFHNLICHFRSINSQGLQASCTSRNKSTEFKPWSIGTNQLDPTDIIPPIIPTFRPPKTRATRYPTPSPADQQPRNTENLAYSPATHLSATPTGPVLCHEDF